MTDRTPKEAQRGFFMNNICRTVHERARSKVLTGFSQRLYIFILSEGKETSQITNLELSSWRKPCRPRRRPLHSGTLMQCHRTPNTVFWASSSAYIHTWSVSLQQWYWSSHRTVSWPARCPRALWPRGRGEASPARSDAHSWWNCSSRWRRRSHRGCGGWCCPSERRGSTVPSWCTTNSWNQCVDLCLTFCREACSGEREKEECVY